MLIVRRRKSNFKAILISIVGFVVLAVFIITLLGNATATSGSEALIAVENSVIRATLSCYAYEGFYPDNIDYLIDNYSLMVDLDKYLVYYDKLEWADNLMPNIIVLDLEADNQ